ncbi:MAG: Ig-like domain-containing protein [bacterium]
MRRFTPLLRPSHVRPWFLASVLTLACVEPQTAPLPTRASDPAAIAPLTSRVSCVADVRVLRVTCGTGALAESPALFKSASPSGPSRDLILGGQNSFVKLASSNVAYAGDVFSFNTTVTNLIEQSLGTSDGLTVDPAGVRVFMESSPQTLTGSGAIDYTNPAGGGSLVDGFATFTQSNQAYYQYAGILHPLQASSARTWRLHVPSTVLSFSFVVYVDAPVQYPTGWIELTPPAAMVAAGNSVPLTATVKDAVGRTLGGQTVTYSTSNSAVASVSPSGVVGGVADGAATITATSTTRTGSAVIAVGAVAPVAYQLSGLDLGLHADGSAPGSPVSEAKVLALMLRLMPYAKSLRSYSMSNGDEFIVVHGHQLGFQVACSAFLNNSANDPTEIAALNAAIDRGLCDLAVVGTETFTSTPLQEGDLLHFIQLVAPHSNAAGIRVTTAQTFDQYLNHRALFNSVDVVFANFFPYWQGTPVDTAIAPLFEGFQLVDSLARALGKTVIVSEAGHPSAGNAFVASPWGPPGAIPSPTNASSYFLSFASWARALNVPYYYFSAYDEPGKATVQLPQEGHFGIWDGTGVMKTGMQQVFDGVTLPLVGGAGTPSIQFAHVPTKGSLSDVVVTGTVSHVKPADYAVALYIKVSGSWINKPFYEAPAVAVLADGSWRCVYVTGGSDQDATDIAAFLIPITSRPPILVFGQTGTLPSALAAYPTVQVTR